MRNNDVFRLSQIMQKLQSEKIDNIDFAFQLINLEKEIKDNVEVIQSVIKKMIEFDDDDKSIDNDKLELQAKQSSLSYNDFQIELQNLNTKYSNEQITKYNDKQAKLMEILNSELSFNFTKLSKSQLPKGLTLEEYKLLLLISE